MAIATRSPEMPVEEVAEMPSTSADQVYPRLRAGLIPGRKLGRRWIVNRADFLRWLEQGNHPAEAAPADRLPHPFLDRLFRDGEVKLEITIRLAPD